MQKLESSTDSSKIMSNLLQNLKKYNFLEKSIFFDTSVKTFWLEGQVDESKNGKKVFNLYDLGRPTVFFLLKDKRYFAIFDELQTQTGEYFKPLISF